MKKLLVITAAFIGLAPLAAAQIQGQLPPVQPQYNQAILSAFTDPGNVPADLARVDAAMNSTVSFSGRFAQYASDGSFAQGQVYIKRPGKLRFEYDAPNPLLIVSDGVTLTQQDKALETIDRVPLSATPLNFFLKENINLADDTEVTSLIKTHNEWRVTARDGSGEMDGAITCLLYTSPSPRDKRQSRMPSSA